MCAGQQGVPQSKWYTWLCLAKTRLRERCSTPFLLHPSAANERVWKSSVSPTLPTQAGGYQLTNARVYCLWDSVGHFLSYRTPCNCQWLRRASYCLEALLLSENDLTSARPLMIVARFLRCDFTVIWFTSLPARTVVPIIAYVQLSMLWSGKKKNTAKGKYITIYFKLVPHISFQCTGNHLWCCCTLCLFILLALPFCQ